MIAMPMQRALYPSDWEAISLRIRERAQWRCEACGVAQGAEVASVSDKGKMYRIVLTVAHLNHDPADCSESNLRAWCQSCHLRYDVEHHARNRARHRREAQVEAGQLALWEPAITPSPRADASPSALAEVPVYLENASDASPQPQQVAARAGDDTLVVAPSESHRRRSQRHTGKAGRSTTAIVPPTSTPLLTKPLVWGKWPTAEEPLMIVSGGDGDSDDSGRCWVFVREMACGKDLLGVLLAPWEQRSERERVEQRWVAIERVRRVIESTAKGK